MKSKIFIAGHRGMVGSALVRKLKEKGYSNLLMKTRDELNLLDQGAVRDFLKREKPDYIFVAAARVGGIVANSRYKAEFLFENLMIEANLIHSAKSAGVNAMLFLGSSCIYPKECLQPIKEEYLLTGPLESTNEPYAIAKIAGIKLCEAYNFQYGTAYVSLMPTNLYGPNDNYDLQNGHVLPSLIRKAHEAKIRGDAYLSVWGTGTPRREFLYVDDIADACVFAMEKGVREGIYNVGSGHDLSIKDVALAVMKVVGFNGDIKFDTSKPDGTQRKLLDSSRFCELGWRAKIPLDEGLSLTYGAYLNSGGLSNK